MHPLTRFLHPRRAALIGVPAAPGRPGYSLFQKIRNKVEGEGGEVFPIHPNVEQIDGLRCHARIQDVPGEIDVAVILVSDVATALADCCEKGVAFVVVFTAGFAETGADGAAAQERLVAMARAGGVRLFGPNTNLNAFEIFRDLPGKKVALITQSGHQGRPIVQGEEFGIPFRYWIPTGNEADLECCDFIEYLAEDEQTAVIAAYIEGFKSGARLRQAADLAARRRKPVVLIKIGRSEPGARMALAHTGHLAGSDAAHDGFFAQYGWVRVDDLDELLETAALFARLPEPRRGAGGAVGDGVCLYGISGGTGALLADLCGAAGLSLPTLSEATQARLRRYIPGYLTVANPVDNGATPIMAGHGADILAALLDDPDIDLLVCPITGALAPLSDRHAQDLADAWRSGRKPMVGIWSSPKLDEKAFQILVDSGMPLFRSSRNAVKALRAYFAYHRFADAYESPSPSPPAGETPLRSIGPVPHGSTLSEAQSKDLLRSFGVPVTRERVCATSDEAVHFAAHHGGAIALKISSPDIAHKSDSGLVRLDVVGSEAVRRGFDALVASARRQHPEARIDGVLAQEMVSGGVEMLVGITRDPVLGALVVAGFGGVDVETWRDVAMRTIPLHRRDAEEMLRQLRGYPLLEGRRGRPPADVAALVDAILRLAAFAEACGEQLLELDVNPLLVLPEGRGVIAADALVVLSGERC